MSGVDQANVARPDGHHRALLLPPLDPDVGRGQSGLRCGLRTAPMWAGVIKIVFVVRPWRAAALRGCDRVVRNPGGYDRAGPPGLPVRGFSGSARVGQHHRFAVRLPRQHHCSGQAKRKAQPFVYRPRLDNGARRIAGGGWDTSA